MKTQLPARPDPPLDLLIRTMRESLGVPLALVSVVGRHRQVFPGASGLPEPWQSERQTPLSHSICQYVVADDAPLIVADLRLDERLRDNSAIDDLGAVAYAGYPLRVDGVTIGAVCAIDSRPRSWVEADLAQLAAFAQSCAIDLEQRLGEPVSFGDAQVGTAEFACTPQSVSVARGWARAQLQTWLAESPTKTDVIDSIELLVSELATNAVRAGSAGLSLMLRVGRDQVLVAAKDDAAGTPLAAQAGGLDNHGRGLSIVAALADAWGVQLYPTGKDVWATLPLSDADCG